MGLRGNSRLLSAAESNVRVYSFNICSVSAIIGYRSSWFQRNGEDCETILSGKKKYNVLLQLIYINHQTFCSSSTLRWSIPQAPRLQFLTNLYFRDLLQPSTSHFAGEEFGGRAGSRGSGRAARGTENESCMLAFLELDIHLYVLGGVGARGGSAGSASGSAASSSPALFLSSVFASAFFLPLGRVCFFSNRLMVSIYGPARKKRGMRTLPHSPSHLQVSFPSDSFVSWRFLPDVERALSR